MTNQEYLETVVVEHNKEVQKQKEITGNWSIEEILSAIDQLLSK